MKLNKRIAGAMVGVGLLVGMLGSGAVLAQPRTSAHTEIHKDGGAGDLDDVQVEDGSQADDDSEISIKSADQDNVQEEDVSEADDASEMGGVKIEDD